MQKDTWFRVIISLAGYTLVAVTSPPGMRLPQFGFAGSPQGNPQPVGGALIAELGTDEFLVAGYHMRISFDVADPARGAKMQFARVEEGTYENGAWKFQRLWNGDQTDWGLNFTSVPQWLKVRLATY